MKRNARRRPGPGVPPGLNSTLPMAAAALPAVATGNGVAEVRPGQLIPGITWEWGGREGQRTAGDVRGA